MIRRRDRRVRPYFFGGPRSGPGRDLLASFVASLVTNVGLSLGLLVVFVKAETALFGPAPPHAKPAPVPYSLWFVVLAVNLALTWAGRRSPFLMRAFLMWTGLISLFTLILVWVSHFPVH